MKNPDEILDRLFRAATTPAPPAEMPFGFDTRVLALARESSPQRIGHHRPLGSARCHDCAGSHCSGVSGSLSRLNF